eukprot:CAMPEP_0117076158 /NCGR_PEP_ID=MMETSP0472-20121206/53687_1 /TAXON_ID=693140 ORGANISM="Tiarina fusus, Strain LIS" /NCGR_SAMPLE_ID=MMETSP0472 /ASSEMBLY_ACC=CAM_ASM_000603 /LENGTH=94 /DNA_ID=CAMNT_0004801945 /DNA_START=354 /DNA_END=635 /DNA_ORIENTATION=-
MLQIDPRDRPTIDEVLVHEFVSDGTSDSVSPRRRGSKRAIPDIRGGIPASCSQPNLAEILNTVEQEHVAESDEKQEEDFVLSPRGVRVREKRRR